MPLNSAVVCTPLAPRFEGITDHLKHWMWGKPFEPGDIKSLRVQALEALIREAAAIQNKRHPYAPMAEDEKAILNHEFDINDVARLLPARHHCQMVVFADELLFPENSCQLSMAKTMLWEGLWAKVPALDGEKELPKYRLTPRALRRMGFDRETMKTRFSEVNLNPVKDPIVGILKAIVDYYENYKKTKPDWVANIHREAKSNNPFAPNLHNINAHLDTPQEIYFQHFQNVLLQENLIREIMYYSDYDDRDPYYFYEITDKGLERLKAASPPAIPPTLRFSGLSDWWTNPTFKKEQIAELPVQILEFLVREAVAKQRKE